MTHESTEPWVNRQQVTGPALHALVIGVSEYAFLPATQDEFPRDDKVTLGLTKLKTPAAGAFRFAKWLRDRYWHPTVKVKTIRLLISPSTEERENEIGNPGENVLPASSANVAAALEDWKTACRGNPDGIAVMYVAGHGVRWDSEYDSLILLEDFGTEGQFLSETVAMEKTLKRMSNTDLPATQFYFADSCRVNPDEAKNWDPDDPPGTPIAPRQREPKNNAVICAPLFNAACTGQTAKGYRSEGTFFSQGLVECLDGYGWMSPSDRPTREIDRYFRITPEGLSLRLPERVQAIAARHGEFQQTEVNRYPLNVTVFSASEKHPVAPVELTVDPKNAAEGAKAILNGDDGNPVIDDGPQPCAPPPLRLPAVPVGKHALIVNPTAPYKQYVSTVMVSLYDGYSGKVTLR